MKNKLTKLYSRICHKILIAPLCFMAISSHPAFAVEQNEYYNISVKRAEITSAAARNGTTLLIEASKNGDVNLVKSLISRGAEINSKDVNGQSALQYAVKNNHTDVAKILVYNGADTSSLGAQAAAAKKLIAELPASSVRPVIPPSGYKKFYTSTAPSPDFGDPLVNAADKGNIEKAKELVQVGYPVNSTGTYSTTALMRASYRGNDELVDFLVKNGAEVNMHDDAGMSALSFAQLGNKAATQKLLIASGADEGLYADVQPAAGPLIVAPFLLSAVGGTAAAVGTGVVISNSTRNDGSTSSSSNNNTNSGDGGNNDGDGGNNGGDGGGSSGGGGTASRSGPIIDDEKNATGLGVTVAVIGNGVYNSGTYTDGSHAGSATSTGNGVNSSEPYNFTEANSHGVIVWDTRSTDFDGTGIDGTPVGSGEMNGHDTETALIINQIASDANILSVRAFNTSGVRNIPAIESAISYASEKGAQVINNSWGVVLGTGINYDMAGINYSNDPNLDATTVESITHQYLNISDPFTGEVTSSVISAVKTALTAENPSVMVWAAGNDGYLNPNMSAGLYLIDPDLNQNTSGQHGTANADYAKYWLVAAAVKKDAGTYTTVDIDNNGLSSNKCGLTQARCLVAEANSTSHAAAEVSGAVAKLISSNLTPAQAAARVLATAYYLDETGHAVAADGTTHATIGTDAVISSALTTAPTDATIDDNGASNSIYGHGILNPELAVSPYGSLFVNTGEGTSAFLSGSSIKLGKAFGDAVLSSNAKIHAFDNSGNVNSEFGSAKFSIPLVNFISRDNSSLDMDEAMARVGNARFTNKNEYENSKLEFTPYSTDAAKDQIISPEDASKELFGNFTYNVTLGSTNYELGQNVKMSQMFGFGAITDSDVSNTISDSSQSNPYLGFAQNGFSSSIRNDLTENLSIKLGMFNGIEKNMYADVSMAGNEVSGSVGEATYSLGDASIGLQVGSVMEKGAFLGSQTTGVFATDGWTPTNFVGISAQNKLTDNFNIFGYYVTGNSTPVAGANTLFSGGISNITSSAFSLGMSYDGFENKGDSLGFVVSQPLHIEKGTASFDSGSSKLSLTPSGREIDVESYYSMQLGGNVSGTISSMYRTNPDNIATNKDEAIALFKLHNMF